MANVDKKMPTAYESEDRRSVSITVAWMLVFLVSVVAQPLTLLTHYLFSPPPGFEGEVPRIAALPVLMFILSLATGTIALILTPLVYRFRQVPPPTAITYLVIIVGALPWAFIGFSAFWSLFG